MEEEEDEEKKDEKEEDEEEESLCQAVMTAVLKKNLLHCNNVCITMLNLRNTQAIPFPSMRARVT